MYISSTVIIRHRRENLKKCSLKGLEGKENFHFHTYPGGMLPEVNHMVLLSFEGEELSPKDEGSPLLILDGTWKYAKKIENALQGKPIRRSLPPSFETAYPRRQEDCPEKSRGLASLEAIYLAHLILGRNVDGLLDHYYWKETFLKKNHLQIYKYIC